MTALFGTIYVVTGSGVWLMIGVFAGVLPSISGAGKLLARRYDGHRPSADDERNRIEHQILRSAQRHSGRVTATRVAVDAGCTIEQAEKILDHLAARGFCTLELTESGRIEYQFADLLPEDSGSAPT